MISIDTIYAKMSKKIEKFEIPGFWESGHEEIKVVFKSKNGYF